MSDAHGPETPSVLAHLEKEGRPASCVQLEGRTDDLQRLLRVRRTPAERYAVGDVLDETSRHVVSRAYDFDLQREVVLKVLEPRLREDPEAVGDLVAEAQLWGQLQHPNILPVYELGLMDDQRPFLTARRFEGRRLGSLIDGGSSRSDRRRLLGMLEQVCQGMAYAHARGAVHGSLDADCILVGEFREVQIVGWENAVPPRTDGTAPTPADARVDVDALGRLMASVLLGRLVHAEEVRTELVEALQRSSRMSSEDPALLQLTLECLAEDDAVRPHSALPVADRMSGHLADVERRAQRARVEAFEAEARAREARREADADRHARRRQLVLVLVALASLIGVGWVWTSIRTADRERMAAADEEVGRRVDRARNLRARGALREAAVQARTAGELASTREASRPVTERAHLLASELEGEVRALDAREALEASNRDLVGRLEEIERLRHEGVDIVDTVRAGREVLGEHDLDPYVVGPIATVEGLLERGGDVAARVARLFDAWAVNCGLPQALAGTPDLPDWRVLAEAAAGVGTDPVLDVVREFLATRDYDRLAEEAAAVDPGSVPADSIALMAGELASSLGTMDEAADLLRRASLHHPDSFWVHWQLAEYTGQADPAESFRQYEAALAAEPDSPMALSGVAAYYLMVGQLPRALDFADRALAARPDRPTPRALTVKARIAGMSGDREGAIELYRRATQVSPRWAYSWHALGVALTLAGRPEQALPNFKRSAALRPDNSMNVGAYALALDDAGRKDEAEQVLRKHVEEEEATSAGWLWLAMLVGRQGRWADAIAILDEAIERLPAAGDLHSDLAYYLLLAPEPARDVERAQAHAAKSMELAPNMPQSAGIAGVIAYRLGEYEQAEPLLRRAIQSYKQPASIPPNEDRVWLAMTLQGLGRHEAAREEWDRAMAWRENFQQNAWFFDRVAEEAAPLFR